jgi:hypothetical protein
MKKLLIIFIILTFSCNSEKFYEEYYPSGNLKLKIALDKNGIRNGQFEEYYESGKLKGKGEYFEGVVKDSLFVYYESGKIREKGIFHNGHKQNWWKIFGENNKVLEEEEYYEVNDSAYKNQYIKYNSQGKIDYSKSSFFKFKIPDTLIVGPNLLETNEYYSDKKGDTKFLSILIDNKKSETETIKDTFRNGEIKNGKIKPWFGIYAYKKGKMKIKGRIEEKILKTKLLPNDSAQLEVIDIYKFFEKDVFIKEK